MKKECICTYDLLKKLGYKKPIHSRKCPLFKEYKEAKLLKVDEFHTT